MMRSRLGLRIVQMGMSDGRRKGAEVTVNK
jgi:hypothetical protein